MSELRELKNEQTLSAIAKDPEGNNHYLLFAIIIDISEPYKTEESTNYTTKLKVIDPSFNYRANLRVKNLKFHKFVHINIYTETPEMAPKIQYVGDIIRLRRFKFKFTAKGELMGNMQKYSNWLVYPGDKKGSLFSECYKSYPKNFNRMLTKYERGRLSDLRNWNDSFFFQNSLQFITWWTKCTEEQNKRVDLILKCQKIDYKKQILSFIDEEKNTYVLTLKAPPNKIENNVIKLRCVDVKFKKKGANQITLTNMSSCLLVPSYFYDARRFNKLKDKGKQSVSKSLSNLTKQFTFLSNYDLKTKCKGKGQFVSVVKNSHKKNKPTSVEDLMKYLKNPGEKINQKFLVESSVIGLLEHSHKNVIKILEEDNKKIHSFNSKVKRKHKYIFNLVFLIGKGKKNVQVYAITDQEEFNLFNTWNILPKGNEIKKWKSVKQK